MGTTFLRWCWASRWNIFAFAPNHSVKSKHNENGSEYAETVSTPLPTFVRFWFKKQKPKYEDDLAYYLPTWTCSASTMAPKAAVIIMQRAERCHKYRPSFSIYNTLHIICNSRAHYTLQIASFKVSNVRKFSERVNINYNSNLIIKWFNDNFQMNLANKNKFNILFYFNIL